MTHVDLAFPARGRTVPVDHGYPLYGALSRRVPDLHKAEWLGVHPIGGKPLGRDMLAVGRGSAVTLRLPAERIGGVLPLAGATLDLNGATLVLGAPSVRALEPTSSLDARLVIIKLTKVQEKPDGSLDVEALRAGFMAELRRQLDRLGLSRPFTLTGRRAMTVGGKRIVGFSVRVTDLEADESVRLQIEGLGGKRAMGCGVFRPTRAKVGP